MTRAKAIAGIFRGRDFGWNLSKLATEFTAKPISHNEASSRLSEGP